MLGAFGNVVGVGGGAQLRPLAFDVAADTANVPFQLTSNFASPTFALISGTGVTVSSSGAGVITTALAPGATRSFLVEVAATGRLLRETIVATGAVPIPVANLAAISGVTEGASAPVTVTITVNLTSAAPAGGSSVAWAVTGQGSDPANAADFVGGVLPSGTINVVAGATSGTATFQVLNDGGGNEATEGVRVTIGDGVRCTIGTAFRDFSIVDAIAGGGVISTIGDIPADGWRPLYLGTPPSVLLNEPQPTVLAEGYDAAGAEVMVPLNYSTTQRYYDPGTFTPAADNTVCLDKVIPRNAIVPGRANNSTVDPPIVIANWLNYDGVVVGNQSRTVRIMANHAYGPAACCEVTWSVGTGRTGYQITKRVSAQSWAPFRKPTYNYEVTLTDAEMATFPAGVIYENAIVKPRVGRLASVLDTQTSGYAPGKFRQRYIIKDPARVAAGWRCYVATGGGGDDATGVFATEANDALARANPFATAGGASGVFLAARRNQVTAGGFLPQGDLGGVEIRALTLDTPLVTVASAGLTGAAVIFTGDPLQDKAATSWILTGTRIDITATGTMQPGTQQHLIVRGCTWRRAATANFNVNNNSNAWLIFDDCLYNNSGINFPLMSNGFSTNVYWGGNTFSGITSSGLAPAAVTCPIGYYINNYGNLNGAQIPFNGVVAGNYCWNAFTNLTATLPANAMVGAHFSSNFWLRINGARFTLANGFNCNSFAWFDNVFESIGPLDAPGLSISADGQSTSTYNLLDGFNTEVGYIRAGFRQGNRNDTYVDDSSDPPATDASRDRVHLFRVTVGNIMLGRASKHSTFSSGAITADPLRSGGAMQAYGCMHGVNAQLHDITSLGVDCYWTAPGSIKGTLTTPIGGSMAANFVNPQVSTNGSTPGAGLGDYRLLITSPIAAVAVDEWLPGRTWLGAMEIAA